MLLGMAGVGYSKSANIIKCEKKFITHNKSAYYLAIIDNDTTDVTPPTDTESEFEETSYMSNTSDDSYTDPDTPAEPLPDTPDYITVIPGTVKGKYDTGSHDGTIAVSNSGAAVYTLDIDAPNGGTLTPHIALSYNSQAAGYGLVGYGFNINGISTITRGGRDMFHDNRKKGVTYTTEDIFFLDGKRLILLSGTSGQEGAVYTVEGEPYTKVVVHGIYNNNTANTWFEVKTNTGMTYQYGNSANSKLSYRNKNGHARIASWYINRVEDKYTNYITYDYASSGMNIRPVTISYGNNCIKSRGINNKISFTYSSLGKNSRPFAIEDQRGITDVCLSSITTSCNDSVYRQYSFTYDGEHDNSEGKLTRLVTIDERNGKGDRLPPIRFTWAPLPSYYARASQLDVPTKNNNTLKNEITKQFLAADMTGDGISDIIRISVKKGVSIDSDSHEYNAYVYVSRSNVSSSGSVTYDAPIVFELPKCYIRSDIDITIGGTSVTDIDGDGYNDLIVAYHNKVKKEWNNEFFHIIRGSDVVAGNTNDYDGFDIILNAKNQTPLIATFDTDGDGKEDVVSVETRKKNGFYQCTILRHKARFDFDERQINIKLDGNPEEMFTGDFNNDGLTDMIFLYRGGYKIYYNNGGAKYDDRFCEDNTKSGTDLGCCWRMKQGDFDGDGLTDFVYNKSGESFLRIAYNNGNGTFRHVQTEDLGVSDHSTNYDNDKFSIMVWDMDNDGRSDIMVCKAMYIHHGSFKFKNEYKETRVRWLCSTGTNMKLCSSYTKKREYDALENNIFLGDFDGDGNPELANYGSILNSSDDSFNEKINIYRSPNDLYKAGKIICIVDGMRCHNYIKYSYTTNPLVYRKTIQSKYPVNTYSLPISVVESINSDNGVAHAQTINYYYEDLRLHIAGRGMLGFNGIAKENITLGTKSVTKINKWNEEYWIPTEIEETNHVGNNSSVTTSTSVIERVGNNYFAHISRKETTDLDGNTAVVTTNYDVSKGVVTDETVSNDGDNMYRKVAYSDYQNKSGIWLPTVATMTMKHKDDPNTYTSVTTYGYDDKGNVTSTTLNSGTDVALKTTSTYDVYGNIVSSVSTGNGVKTIKKYNDYDASGRFIVKNYTTPASAVNTFTYDIWGNMLTETDATEPANILTTKHTYDNWGRKELSTTANGTTTYYMRAWADSYTKKYCVREYVTGKPHVTTWFDQKGREMLQETTGAKGVAITKTTSYNSKGEVSKVETKTGKLTLTQTFTYDDRGRVLTDVTSTGKSVSYNYGNRSVTATTAKRSYTKTVDAWGNVVRATDPMGEVEYVYSSIGKPIRIKAHGSEVTMSYDAAGNQVSLTDPDAGTSNYKYAADGALLTQTDGRGIETVNTYDDLGRLASVRIGENTITYSYGTSGNEKLRLVKTAMGDRSVEYVHDKFGRIVTEKRSIGEKGTYSFSYEYNKKSQLAKTFYPGGLSVTYKYDDNGFKTKTTAGNHVIYKEKDFNGLVSSSSFLGKLTTTRTRDESGYEKNICITYGTEKLETFNEKYDGVTGNLIFRQRIGEIPYKFEYDNLDRLTSVEIANIEIPNEDSLVNDYISMRATDNGTMGIRYADNGNIIFKTGVGNYKYDNEYKPHAVAEVENVKGYIPSDALTTAFNDLGKIQTIENAGNNMKMDFVYGPDQERWYSELSDNGNSARTTIYAGDYEKITENGTTREFYYLDGNTIIIKENGVFKPYIAFTDNLGSILSVFDDNGKKVFDASYDAWGWQSVGMNAIGLHRGYTGHEMLEEFGIINMNGRLYDPILGRFFSPDNYVQMPDNSQNFNRYSYCLNNPLKYTDPSGELAWFIPVIAGAIVGAYTGASIQSGTAAFWKWKSDAWKGAIVGGIIGGTIGYGLSSALTTQGAGSTITGLLNKSGVITKTAGITSSILHSGAVNMAINAISNGGLDGAWKSGIVGLITGAWAINGGFGMVKGLGTKSKIMKLAGKLGYQMVGTTSQSIGNNWAAGKGLFSKITLGIGPVNLTIGKGQKLLQWQNNLGNIAINSFGIINTIAGGNTHFNVENLTFEYYGGLMDEFQNPISVHNGIIYTYNIGFSPHTVTGNSNLYKLIDHELHHLWQSRALNDMFLLNYGLQGINALLLKGNFVKDRNYYEDFVNNYEWW